MEIKINVTHIPCNTIRYIKEVKLHTHAHISACLISCSYFNQVCVINNWRYLEWNNIQSLFRITNSDLFDNTKIDVYISLVYDIFKFIDIVSISL